MLYFFLSYGRNSDDGDVERFFDELSAEVRNQTGSPPDAEVGFLDRASIPLGLPSWGEIGRALAECQVFVPLYSPRTFKSYYCGQEWAAFRLRILQQAQVDGRPPNVLLPVVWRWWSEHEMPPVAAEHQYTWARFDKEYTRLGLSALYRLRGDAYHNSRTLFVAQLAAEIVRRARVGLVASDPLSNVRRLQSAFGPDEAAEESPNGASRPALVHAVIASGGIEDMRAAGRSDLSCYGGLIGDWRPYHPDDRRVVDVIEACGAEKGFRPHVVGVGGLGTRLAGARQHRRVVALIVDPWASSIDGHGDELAEFDRELADPDSGPSRSTPVFVPWSRTDEETQRERDHLTRQLAGLMPNAARQGLVDREDVGSLGEFERAVLSEIGAAWKHVLQQAEPGRTVPGDQPPEPPVIEVP